MIYLIAIFISIVLGLLVNRKFSTILCEQINFLPIFLLSLIIYIGRQLILLMNPELLLLNNRQYDLYILIAFYALSGLFFLLNTVVNLRKIKSKAFSDHLSKQALKLYKNIKQTRIFAVCFWAIALIGISLHASVCLGNHGAIPISSNFSAQILEPVKEAINAAPNILNIKLTDQTTFLPQLTRIFHFPWLNLDYLFNWGFISIPEIILFFSALCLPANQMFLTKKIRLFAELDHNETTEIRTFTLTPQEETATVEIPSLNGREETATTTPAKDPLPAGIRRVQIPGQTVQQKIEPTETPKDS